MGVFLQIKVWASFDKCFGTLLVKLGFMMGMGLYDLVRLYFATQ
jgi:hypothetical protein